MHKSTNRLKIIRSSFHVPVQLGYLKMFKLLNILQSQTASKEQPSPYSTSTRRRASYVASSRIFVTPRCFVKKCLPRKVTPGSYTSPLLEKGTSEMIIQSLISFGFHVFFLYFLGGRRGVSCERCAGAIVSKTGEFVRYDPAAYRLRWGIILNPPGGLNSRP